MSSSSSTALASLIAKQRNDYRGAVASAVPAATSAAGQKFVRRGDVTTTTTTTTTTSSTTPPAAAAAAAQPTRKRPRETTQGNHGVSVDEVARQQRVLILRKKAAEAKAAAQVAAKAKAAKVAAQALAKKILKQQTEKSAASSAPSSSSSSSSSSSVSSSAAAAAAAATSAASAKPAPQEPIPREDSVLELEDAKVAGKNLRRIFKLYLDEWSEDLRQRGDQEKRSGKGREDAKLFKECKDNIRPLFKLSRQGELASDLRIAIRRIAHYSYVGEYVKAHDEYIGIAIGNAAWPIGVTMVGIHARGGREKISKGNIAHAMDDEMTLKYLTSIKRLVSYAQRKHPSAPSKMVLS